MSSHSLTISSEVTPFVLPVIEMSAAIEATRKIVFDFQQV